MKWFPDLPDSLKGKPGQTSGPCHHFNVELTKPDPLAKKDCPICGGKGRYTTLHVGEYDELPMSVRCSCTNNGKQK